MLTNNVLALYHPCNYTVSQ